MERSTIGARRMMRVIDASVIERFRVRLTFDDGVVKTVDVGPFLRSNGSMVRPLREDPELFAAARAEGGTVVWPNGFDLDPDVLYYDDLRDQAIERARLTLSR